MAITSSVVRKSTVGPFKLHILEQTLDASYATGGEAVVPSKFGLEAVLVALIEADADGYVIKYDRANDKIMAFQQTDPGDTGGADIALVEVGSGTNLASVVVRVLAIGI